MVAKGERISVFLWSDSHGAVHHHLPQFFDEKLRRSKYYSLPQINAFSGKELTAQIKERIVRNMDSFQVHILLIGSNNIRRKGDNQLLPRFQSIVQHASTLEKCHVVLCGFFPSPRTDKYSRDRFFEASNQLKTLSRAFPHHTSFLGLQKGFTFNGEIRNELFHGDGIHLNEDGAERLAELLTNCLGSFGKTFFQNS